MGKVRIERVAPEVFSRGRRAKRIERVGGHVDSFAGRRPARRIERVAPAPTHSAGPSPLVDENRHLIGQFIEFNDVAGRYHLAEIKGVVKARPNLYDSRLMTERAIVKEWGLGKIVWSDVQRYRNTQAISKWSAKERDISRRDDWEVWLWVVQGILERDQRLSEDENALVYDYHLLLPITLGSFIASPASAPETLE